MPKHKISISPGEYPLSQRVEVDGHDISHGLRSLKVEFPANSLPRVELELSASTVEVVRLDVEEAEVMLSLPTGAREALVALGWTPPAGDR